MAGIDGLVSRSFSESIKNNLEPVVLRNIERRLFLKYGMSIKLSVEHFSQFLGILKENSSLDTRKFHEDIMNENIQIQKSNDGYFLRIINLELSNLILQFFSDVETREILSCLLIKEMTIPNILKELKIPKTSGYRKIENLIINGMIIEAGKIMSESKKVSKYKCCFDEIKIGLNKEGLDVVCVINEDVANDSTSIYGFI